MWSTNNFYCLCQVWSLQGDIMNCKSLPPDKAPIWLAPGFNLPFSSMRVLGKFQFLKIHCFNGWIHEFNGCFSGVRWQREGHRFLCSIFTLARMALVRWLKREKWIIWQFKTRETSQRLFFLACRSPSYLALLPPFICIICVSSSSYDDISSAFRVHFFGSLLL